MRRSILLLLAPLAVACSAASVDVPTGDEMDSDEDGLNDAEEYELGTDPDAADSDGDGFDDVAELEDGSDPTSPKDRPYLGGWKKDRSCNSSITPTGNAEGEVAENFTLTDQYGDEVSLYDFCGRAILLVSGAAWCGPCQQEAATLEELYQRYADQGFMVFTLLGEDLDSHPPSLEVIQEWADTYGQTFPVLSDGDWTVSYRFEKDYGIPSLSLLGPGATVITADGWPGDAEIEAALPQ